ncbi:hypothetical protein [Arenimonas daejeonensis]|uniref:hypothetical protein n=1 Tax=Arenimonas daejeonensis TaxID=370777 RepID=UPI003CCD3AA3
MNTGRSKVCALAGARTAGAAAALPGPVSAPCTSLRDALLPTAFSVSATPST